MSPQVTAVITTHVRPHHVHEALASVRNETQPDVEIVVVDDGGVFTMPDGDRADVRVVRGGGVGVAQARNLGLDAARGEFVIFLDDDDVALSHRIETLLLTARQYDAALCFGMTRRVRDDAAPLADVPTQLLATGAVGFCDLLTCTPHVNAVLARTDALRAVGGFHVDAHHFDDWSAWLRIADGNAVIRHVANQVAEWRIHDAGLSAVLINDQSMQRHLLAFFERLQPLLSDESAQAVAFARRVAASSAIVSYDDYVNAMAAAREALHAGGTCLGRRLASHATRV